MRNGVVLAADGRAFELPAGPSNRLHARPDQGIELAAPKAPDFRRADGQRTHPGEGLAGIYSPAWK